MCVPASVYSVERGGRRKGGEAERGETEGLFFSSIEGFIRQKKAI